MPTLAQLEYIVAVDRLKHFGRAAEACHVSQPSLSAQIQKVEEDLGLVIFDRLKKPITTTEKGRSFIDQARVVLDEQRRLLEVASTDKGEASGDFRLGIIPTLTPYLLPRFLGPFSEKFQKVRLRIDEMKTESIIQELKNDKLDAGILATPLKEEALRERFLFQEKFFVYFRKDHPLTERRMIREDDLPDDLWVLQDGHCLRNQVLRICSSGRGSGRFKNLRFEGGNLETLRYLIRENAGYTLVPELFVLGLSPQERSQSTREFSAPAPSREISLVFRKHLWKTEILKALETTVRTCLPSEMTEAPKRGSVKTVPIG